MSKNYYRKGAQSLSQSNAKKTLRNFAVKNNFICRVPSQRLVWMQEVE